MHIFAAHLPGSPLSVRLGESFEGVRANSFGRIIRVISFGWVGRMSPCQKMLSCDPMLALCMFVQLVCPALPCPFVWVSHLRACVSTRSSGSGEGIRVSSFRRVGRRRARQTSSYQKMLSCDPRLALCTFVQLVCPALPCPFVWASRLRASVRSRSGELVHAGRSGELVRAGRSGELVQAGRSGGSFGRSRSGEVVRAGRSGEVVRAGRSGELVQAGRARAHPGERARIKKC